MLLLRLAFREIRSNRRFSAAFCLNLGLGLFGFALLGAFQTSVENSFQARSRELLTADLAVSARRALSEAELETLRKAVSVRAPYQETHVIELYSMASVVAPDGASRLVQVSAIEDRFPLYGEIELKGGTKIRSETPKTLLRAPEAWISQELGAQLGIGSGRMLRIGETEFRIGGVIEQDASSGWRGFALAPGLYVGLPWLEKTGLIRKGSTLSHSHLFRLEGMGERELEDLSRALNQALPDPGIRVTTHRTAGEQMTRTLSYLSDYLGLVALVGLFLAGLGSAYLFQSFLSRRLREIATLISLGLTHAQAIGVYLVQALLLGLISAALAVGAALLALPAAHRKVEQALDASLKLEAGIWGLLPSLSGALLGGIAASVLVCLPMAIQIRRLKPSLLFQESATPSLGVSRASGLATLPLAVLGYFLAVWQAHSWKVGSLFFVSLAASTLILALLAWAVLQWVGRAKAPHAPIARISLRYLARNRLSTLSAFLAIGLGALLINLLPQLQRNIESEIQHPEVSSVPSLFLFDIQEEQVDPLKDLLEAEGAQVMELAPLIRARLEAINEAPFEKPLAPGQALTREEEQEARSRNRGFNLTFREKLSESETLVEGREFQGTFHGGADPARAELPEISVEFRFAERLGLKLGDELRFNIEGVPVEGRIVSLRRVKWTSFQPNFFVVFQPGALDAAPKTYLASVPKLGLEQRTRIQGRLVRELGNVSIIDVTTVVQKMLQAFEQMAFAIRLMAAIAVLAGLVVLYSIASHQSRSRQAEIQLLKVLGAERRDVSRIFLIEFGLIGALSSAFGVVISTMISYGISAQLFDGAWSFSGFLPLVTVSAVTALTLLTTQAAALRSLRSKPAGLLGE